MHPLVPEQGIFFLTLPRDAERERVQSALPGSLYVPPNATAEFSASAAICHYNINAAILYRTKCNLMKQIFFQDFW